MTRSGLLPAFAAAAVAAVLLAACTTVPRAARTQDERQALYDGRRADLVAREAWSLEGRLAVREADDGGSGTFRWRMRDENSEMDFHGALGRGAWRLVAGDDGATLEFADGASYRAGSVGELVSRQLGWNIPVESLSWWVRGLAAPGAYRQRLLDERGHIERLEQKDWTIEYGRYREIEGLDMPSSLTARQEDRVVKLAVRSWQLEGGQDGKR